MPLSLHLRRALHTLASLGLPLFPLAACDADAQRQPATASADAEGYRLTMPVLRQALAVLYAPEGETGCHTAEGGWIDPRYIGVAEIEAQMAECPGLTRVAAAQDISLRDLAQAYKALTLASERMAEEEAAKLSGRNLAPLPPGPLRDNVALLRENEAEIARYTQGSE